MAGSNSRGLRTQRNYMGNGGWPFNFPFTFSDGTPGTVPPPPVPPSGNPYYQWNANAQKFEPIPGSPADK